MEINNLPQNNKAQQFKSYLEEKKIEAFTLESVDDEVKSVVFRSRFAVDGQELPMIVLIDNSLYTTIRAQVTGPVPQSSDQAAIAELIRQYNQNYKIVKYYLNERNELYMDCCLPFMEEHFDSAMIHTILQAVLQHLNEVYPAIMRCFWSKRADLG